MGRYVDPDGLPRQFRDQGTQVLHGVSSARRRRDPERAIIGVAATKHRVVRLDVVVDYFSDEPRHLTFVDTMGLGFLRWNVQPPSATRVDKSLSDRQCRKVLD